MNFIEKDTGLSLFVKQELLDRLYQFGMEHYPKEYGGLLIGRYSEDKSMALIENTVLPKRYTSSKLYFERETDGLKEILHDFYNQKPSLIYLGEWHTHPDGRVDPSPTDCFAMKKIVADSNVVIKNPLLLILGVNKESFQYSFYVQTDQSLKQYQKRYEGD